MTIEHNFEFNFSNINVHKVLSKFINFANELIEAKYKKALNLRDQRVLFLALALQNYIENPFFDGVLNIPKKLVLDVVENSGEHYDLIQDSLDKLVKENTITIITPNGEIRTYAWLSYANYKPGNDYVQIKLNPDLFKYLFLLKANYTQLPIKCTFCFNTKYSHKLYTMLYRYTDTGWRQDSVSDLREKLGVESNEYRRIYDFEKKVLKPSISDINKFSDITVSYEKIKIGNKVTHIKFYISLKSKLEAIKIESSQEDGIRLLQVLPEQDKQEEINKIKKQLQAMFDSAYKVMLRNDNDRIRSVEAVYKTIKEEEKNQKVIEKVQEYQQEYPEMLRNPDYAMLGPKGKFIWIFSNEEQRMKLIKLYKKKNELENKIRESNGEL